ncbi:MAG TPA: histidine kinase dimerization/phospho-acceptor domain-containing protein, partial [Caulobacteraceae bacterium]
MAAKTLSASRASHRPRNAPARPSLFQGDSDVRKLMRRCDWAATPLGPPDDWPSSLQAIVRAVLTSRFAMWMAWGPELTFLCNDAYLPTVGMRRDWVIGSRSDRVWAEIWPDIGPRIEHVLTTAEATWDEALLLYLERSGFREETYHTFSYSPLADDAGATTGMLCVVAEETERVIGARQLAVLRDLGARLAAASARPDVMQAIEASIAEEPRDLPFALVYLIESERGAVRGAVSGLTKDDPLAAERVLLDDLLAPWPLSLAAAAPRLVDIAPDRLAHLPQVFGHSPPSRALVTPIGGVEGGTPIGFFVAGLNANHRLDTGYQGFVTLLTAQISAALARTDEYDRARQRAEALAQIDRAKTAFFSNVSHEFRTPLTLMLGPLEDEIAERLEREDSDQGERLKLAHRNAMRLLRLVNTLLDFSRIEAGRIEARYRPTDLAQATADLAASFRSATDKAGLGLTVETP